MAAGFEYRVNGGTPVNVGNVLQALASALTPETEYLFEVRSYDREGIRSAWVPVSVETPDGLPVPTGLTLSLGDGLSILAEWDAPPDEIAPTAPVLSSAVADSDTEITMIWAASTDNVAVTGYQTRIDGGSWVDRGLILTYQYTGLTASTEYDFEVRAYDAAGNFSAASNLISEMTDAPPPPNPWLTALAANWIENPDYTREATADSFAGVSYRLIPELTNIGDWIEMSYEDDAGAGQEGLFYFRNAAEDDYFRIQINGTVSGSVADQYLAGFALGDRMRITKTGATEFTRSINGGAGDVLTNNITGPVHCLWVGLTVNGVKVGTPTTNVAF